MNTQDTRIDFGNVGWRLAEVPITFGSKAGAERWRDDHPEEMARYVDPVDRIPVYVDTRPTIHEVRQLIAAAENAACGVESTSAYGTVGPWDEYFSTQRNYESGETKANTRWPAARWVAVYVVPGTSEGLYLHVDLIDSNGVRELVFLGKTCGCNRETWARCYESAGRISYMLNH